jgi:lysophospholipase L1-like esterase
LASWNQRVCEGFAANCSIVAWSGKGMYENCCDTGITMRDLYLQTRGGTPYSADWDFTSFVPDALVINLGTNDFNHDNGTAWEAAFTATYVSFVRNATARYGDAALPVFVAQGNMNRAPALQAALAAAIAGINGAGGNATFLDLRVGPNDGCGGHPGVAGHAAMAAAAAPVIARVMGW